jgi:nitroreductase
VSRGAARPFSLVDLLARRHSCRAFLPEQVPADVLMTIFESAQRAPSSCNSQPWSVYLTSGSATADFATALTAHVRAQDEPDPDIDLNPIFTGTYLDRKRTCGMALYESIGIERSDYASREAQMLRNYQFFDAPHVAVFTSAGSLGATGLIDTGGFMVTVGLLAQELGVATVSQGAIALYAGFLHDYLHIPGDEVVIGAMSIGYEDIEHPINGFRTDRANAAEVVHTFGWTV